MDFEEQYLMNLMDTDSSDDDLLFLENAIRRKKDYIEHTVVLYENAEFVEHFRLSRHVVEQLVPKFVDSSYYSVKSGQYGSIPPYNQILIFLWYLGHQTVGFAEVSNQFSISLSSLERIIRKVSLFLSNLSAEIIKWPTMEEKRESALEFASSGFPNVIGVIDGSHIKIDKPENDSDSYINRNGYYSIQIQAICDKKCKILDICIGYPGTAHDSHVFRHSPIGTTLENKCGSYYLLGDSGYPLRPNLLTPFKDNGMLTESQMQYNTTLYKNRYVIEHCFGVLKQRFRQLHHMKLRKMEYIIHMISAACVLHNIAQNDEFEDDLRDVAMNDVMPSIANDEDDDNYNEEDRNAVIIRNNVVDMLF